MSLTCLMRKKNFNIAGRNISNYMSSTAGLQTPCKSPFTPSTFLFGPAFFYADQIRHYLKIKILWIIRNSERGNCGSLVVTLKCRVPNDYHIFKKKE